ncbi:thiosulfate:glutathione sulfurtransferase-like [Stigmatopora argus]
MTDPANMDISCEDLKALLDKHDKNLCLIDVRTPEEVAKGRIPTSFNIPLEDVEGALGLSPEAFKAKYGVNKPPLNSKELIFYCHTGRRGGIATREARKLGFSDARNLAGGYKAWLEKYG